MTISFNQILSDIRTPGQYIEVDNSRATQGLPAVPHRILVIGQRLAAGTVAKEVPTQILSGDQAEGAFGRGSMLAEMLKALKAANRHTETWAVALDDDGAGVQADGTITVSPGSATAAGTIYLYVAGYRLKVAVASGDDQDAIAAAIVAEINANTELPVTAQVDGVNANEADLTARNAGEAGNDIDIRVNYFQGETLPAGVSLSVTPMANGTTNPDVSLAIAAIGDTQYHTIVMPYTDAANLTALEAELSTRWGGMVMKEGHAFAAAAGAHAAMITLGDGRNSPHVTIVATNQSPSPPWLWAAVAGAVDAAEPDPARPRQTLALPGLRAPAEPDRWDRAERDLLLHDGISTFIVDAGGVVRVERLITTYQVNPLSVPDTSYLDVTTMRTLAFIREARRIRIALKWPRHKLADDGTLFGPGQAVVTPAVLKADAVAFFRELELAGLVENFDQFKADLIVERDGTDPNRVNEVFPPDIINQLRVFASQVQFRL